MRLKRLELKNFRSYKDAVLEFPLGKILFEGDIGSGKSSILYAIEFALFGLGDLKGDSLIRVAEKKCSVELTFEINGKEYRVGRTLEKKGRGISQTEGYLIEDGVKNYYSSTELRAKILDLLKFKESVKTKSSSVIFRYAIFTPQEEMKEILNLKAEDRLQTLRRAFGIEDYKIAKDNAKILLNELKNRIKFIEGEVADLEEVKKEHKETVEKIAEYKTELNKSEEEKKIYEKKILSIDEKLISMEEKILEVNKLKSEIPLLEKEMEEKNEEVKILKSEIETIEKRIKEVVKEIDEYRSKIEKPKSSLEELEKREKELEDEKEKQRELLTSTRVELSNIKKLLDEKVCPTCKRPVEKAEFKDKIEVLQSEYEKIGNKILEINKELEKIKIEKEKVREIEQQKKELERLEKEISELEERRMKNETKIRELEERLEKLEKEIPEKKKKVDEYHSIMQRVEELKKEKQTLESNLREWISKISTLEGKIKTLTEIKDRLEDKINEKEKLKKDKAVLEEYLFWIQDYFVPALDQIEKHVLQNINEEFNALFQRWFNMLLEGSDINVYVDETFTPIVEQNGYELDIKSLSGGERTSVALAYRLALNMMVRKVCTSLKSNLLILDEPTDGFSKEQLQKVRDVLNEIETDQLILVSHERELEGFVDKIFYVRKEDGISRIEE